MIACYNLSWIITFGFAVNIEGISVSTAVGVAAAITAACGVAATAAKSKVVVDGRCLQTVPQIQCKFVFIFNS